MSFENFCAGHDIGEVPWDHRYVKGGVIGEQSMGPGREDWAKHRHQHIAWGTLGGSRRYSEEEWEDWRIEKNKRRRCVKEEPRQ